VLGLAVVLYQVWLFSGAGALQARAGSAVAGFFFHGADVFDGECVRVFGVTAADVLRSGGFRENAGPIHPMITVNEIFGLVLPDIAEPGNCDLSCQY